MLLGRTEMRFKGSLFEMEQGGLGGKPSPRGGRSGEPDLQHLAKMVLAMII